MQASVEENLNPDHDLCSESEISKDFYTNMKIEQDHDDVTHVENNEEDEFSFMFLGENGSPIAAEDLFINGQIKPVYPLFNGHDSSSLHENLPMNPPVKRVFVVETTIEEKIFEVTSSSPQDDVISGPCCDLSTRKMVEASPEVCKKSNSTGFSKIWRLRDHLVGRSNSDGRDAFVFFNNGPPPPPEKVVVVGRREEKKEAKKRAKTGFLSAHEVYIRSKAKEEERRRSTYLPYRPELMGFFTNVNGGLSKNVHPF